MAVQASTSEASPALHGLVARHPPDRADAIQESMSSYTQKNLHPTPHKTALWLAKVSIGLLLGSALWLMSARAYENKVCLDAFPYSGNETHVTPPAQ